MPNSPSVTRNARTSVVRHIRVVAFAATGGAQTPVLKGLTTSPSLRRVAGVRLIKRPAVKTLATLVGAARPGGRHSAQTQMTGTTAAR